MKQNRRTWLSKIGLVVAGLGIGKFAGASDKKYNSMSEQLTHDDLKLGAFSVSLPVKDLKASKEFYEKLGFKVFGGGMDKNYLIMKNGNALIGLFKGMFDKQILTFNPGWDENAQKMAQYDDIRSIQKHLREKGLSFTLEADEKTTGPASLMLNDPDGNQILLDQHI